jgi:hypothetical protein
MSWNTETDPALLAALFHENLECNLNGSVLSIPRVDPGVQPGIPRKLSRSKCDFDAIESESAHTDGCLPMDLL